ncbi:MAG: PDZ domain-containing protein [Sphingobacteriales bacterium]|nr:MAG: PDZ domain-containing protein [Sphingobacteriales bacterium]
MKSKLVPVVLTAALTSALTFVLVANVRDDLPFMPSEPRLPVNYASYSTSDMVKAQPPEDFESAAEASVQAVVHIKTTTKGRTVSGNDPYFNDDYFGNLFGRRQFYIPPQMGSGSGVVVSPDGYIVTNHHVIANADEVTVTFNDRFTTTAEVVGKDPSTDIALLKVKEKNLPFMEYGNSDAVKLGQWVLAVGYPLTLDATVTAGIVSAKSRSIGINKTQSGNAIESFIQTDAAVNPGNSGGALVNTDGQLIGINSAIASPTGSYAGYSYAIPSNIVRKVVGDLTKYGSVQRGYLGIRYEDPRTLTPERIRELGMDKADGVYVAEVVENSGALKAGIRKGDIITQINGVAVHTEPQLLEQVARYHPGDNINVTYKRNDRSYTTNVELKNIQGTTAIIKGDAGVKLLLGANLKPLTAGEKQQLGVGSGVMVTGINGGIIGKQTNMRKGFVITSINDIWLPFRRLTWIGTR